MKEKGVSNWILPPHISSGMFKTLMYISELYLSPEGSVILIDEFEKSLGVNCLDSVTDLILENPRLEFIITSHHPYIINNIGNKYWKIVTHQGNIITVK
ncbi:AAA family ATPase [Dapis sp. BLCC M172]|uniref:AAA family ATPase n=1 Tax=Dapis sp. BLCC M172 TaxID=2975281 RepID=UPI003CF6F770